ncbi:unnamed protein product [Chondrus crispus]|uniref:Uncharacterized protein n=1 Tax=Chondrus crispus TaxID=2769 RepID=R7QB58_CHOCR|nr:unnamed protein product [Chondrus crispus]CDF34705.1 unnamed protein product [Chondrus crispus]|eukprot:XP_005714524.1 unnamed protein product [Chondrus crispus]
MASRDSRSVYRLSSTRMRCLEHVVTMVRSSWAILSAVRARNISGSASLEKVVWRAVRRFVSWEVDSAARGR